MENFNLQKDRITDKITEKGKKMILVDKLLERNLHNLVDLSKSENVFSMDLHKQVNPNSLDLTISKYYKRPNKIKHPVMYGFSGKDERTLYDLTYWNNSEADDGFIVMKPNDIILGCTREYITMPDDVYGQLFTKSTTGRMFINHMMAGVVDAGFHGRLTLELKNDGVHTIRIPVGAPVVQMICYSLEEKPDRTYAEKSRHSRYMGAETVETAKFSMNK